MQGFIADLLSVDAAKRGGLIMTGLDNKWGKPDRS